MPKTVISPLTEIVSLGSGEIALDGVAGLIFTSQNGVRAFLQRSGRRDIPAWCVGDRTAAVAAGAGLRASSAGGDGASLAALLLEKGIRGPLLHLRGAQQAFDLVGALSRAGLSARDEVIYEQRPLPLTDAARGLLGSSAPVLAPLFSPGAARLFRDATVGVRAPLYLFALSAAVGAALSDCACTALKIASRPDAEAMMALLVDCLAAPPSA